MAYFPDNIMLSRADDLLLINKVNSNPDKVLKGFDGSHIIKSFGSYEISVDSAYRNNLIEEITGLSLHLRSNINAKFDIMHVIRSNTGNEMHRFLKVCEMKDRYDFPISLFSPCVKSSYLPGNSVSGDLSAFAYRYEFFPSQHEAELHIKLDSDYYGPLSSVNNGFYTPVDDIGLYKCLTVSTLMKIKSLKKYSIFSIKPNQRIDSLVAICESKIGDLYVSLPSDALKDRSSLSSRYLWCDMMLSLNVETQESPSINIATLTEYFASAMKYFEFDSLYYRLKDDVELFYDSLLVKGRKNVIDKLKDIREAYQCSFKDIILDESFEGIEAGSNAIAYSTFDEISYYIFIDIDGEYISRIMFRAVNHE